MAVQVYEFTDAQSGAIFIAEPPPGVRLESLLAEAVSKALHSPVSLPLEPLLSCTEATLPTVRGALLPCSASVQGMRLADNCLMILPSQSAILTGAYCWKLSSNCVLKKMVHCLRSLEKLLP